MRIGLNLLFLLPGVVGGTETYATLLIEELARLDATNEYVLFLNAESAEMPLATGGNFRRVVFPFRAANRAARYAWEQLVLPRQLRELRIDVVHSLGYVGPLFADCRHLVTIHDVNYANPAVRMRWHKRKVLGAFVQSVAGRADHILTISEFSKAEIVGRLGVSPDKVTVSHLAPRPRRNMVECRADTHASPYIVAFSGSAQHKNIPRLIEAYASIAAQIQHRLLILGRLPADGSVAQAVTKSGVADRITLSGYVKDSELEAILAGADVLAFPSLYEGFGLPILDAQAAGVAVVCSSAGSLPEVAGRGAILFDPGSRESIAMALVKVTSDGEIRTKLVDAGHDNVRRFSWTSTATTALRLYERLGPPQRPRVNA